MHLVPAFGRLFVQRRHLTAEAGIVDEDVEPAEFFLGRGDHLADIIFTGDIGMDGNCRVANLGGDAVLRAADIGANDPGPFGRKEFRHGLAHARAGPRDDSNLVFQTHR